MKKRKGNLMVGVIASVAALGVGYAAITSVNLNINGSATAKASAVQDDFKVKFGTFAGSAGEITVYTGGGLTPTTNPTTSNEGATSSLTVEDTIATANITGDLAASFNVTDLKQVGDKVVFEIPIVNNSTDIKAALTVGTPTNSNEEYFDISAELKNSASNVLSANGGTDSVVVTVVAKKIPKVNDASGSFTIAIEAAPQE